MESRSDGELRGMGKGRGCRFIVSKSRIICRRQDVMESLGRSM